MITSRCDSATKSTLLTSKSQKLKTLENQEEFLNDEDVILVMKRKLGTDDFRIKNWNLQPIPGTHGFLGQYYNLYVTCSVNDKVSDDKFRFFAKTPPPHKSPQFHFASHGDVFNKEMRIYEDLLQRMGAGNGPKWKVDYYLGKKDVIIVLEDVTLDGYSMPDKYVPFEYDECVLMLCALAKLHSRYLILDEKLQSHYNKTVNEIYGDDFKEALFVNEERPGKALIRSGIQSACDLVDLVEGLDDSAKTTVKNRILKWSWELPNLVRPSEKYRNVGCHRDVWANNFMMKRDAQGRPQACYVIDFQFMSYQPPAVDFMLSLYLTTRRKIRDQHFEALSKVYYHCMRDELETEGLDIESCLPWKEFRESCEEYRPLAIIYVTANQQIMLLDEKSADKYFTKSPELLNWVLYDSGRSELVCSVFSTVKQFKERLTENIFEINERLPDDPPSSSKTLNNSVSK